MTDKIQSEEQQKAILADMVTDYKRTFASEHGKRVLDNLARLCHAKSRTYCPGARTEDSIFAQGQRDVYLHISEMIETQLDIEKPTQSENEPVDQSSI